MSHEDKKKMDLEAFEAFKDCKKILDVGCGRGRFIALDPDRIEGFERSELSIRHLLKYGYKFKEGDILEGLPYEDETFDGIHISHVIEHLYPQEVLSLLYEADRVLKIGGILVIRTPYLHDRFYDDIDHIKPYPLSSFKGYLTDPDNKGQFTFKKTKGIYTLIRTKNRRGDTAFMAVFRKKKERKEGQR